MRSPNHLDGYAASANFKFEEFRCRGQEKGKPCCCHGAVLVHPQVVSVAQMFREYLDEPVRITSAYRCDTYNAAVGGHPGSFHRFGMAADITSRKIRSDMDVLSEELAAILVDTVGPGNGNVIYYPDNNFIHFDVGHQIDDEFVIRRKMADGSIHGYDWSYDG